MSAGVPTITNYQIGYHRRLAGPFYKYYIYSFLYKFDNLYEYNIKNIKNYNNLNFRFLLIIIFF